MVLFVFSILQNDILVFVGISWQWKGSLGMNFMSSCFLSQGRALWYELKYFVFNFPMHIFFLAFIFGFHLFHFLTILVYNSVIYDKSEVIWKSWELC